MSFDNCAQAYDAGQSHIKKTSPLYAKHLDRDRDGIACDNPPEGFVAKPAVTKTAKPQPTATTTAQAGVGTADRLPVTGPGEVGGVAALLLVIGVAVLAVTRRRRRS